MGLSVCMIVKNEARNIAQAVLSARKVADELIIVDTGSTDDTRRILDSMNQPFTCIEWRDSFAAARNESIKLATQSWIMWMDADDVITDDCAMRINALKKREPDSVFMFSVTNANTEMREEIGHSKTFMQMRMFPNHQGLVFSGRVHEQISGEALLKLKIFHAEDVMVEHHGYSLEQHQKESLRRNIRLQMIDLGFPENKDFFSFEMGPDIFCLYSPDTLAMWYRHIYIASINPFVDVQPDTHEARFERMKEAARDYLRVYADSMKRCKRVDNEKMIEDVESAINTGAVNVILA